MTDAAATTESPAAGRTWWTQVRGQAYGPYLAAEVRHFLREGRLRPQSLLGLSPQGPWAPAAQTPAFSGAEPAPPAAYASLLIYGDLPSGAEDAIEADLAALGQSSRLGPGLWMLRSVQSALTVRKSLSARVQTGDRLLVVDASRGRIAWHNLGLEPEVRLRELWCGPLDEGAPRTPHR